MATTTEKLNHIIDKLIAEKGQPMGYASATGLLSFIAGFALDSLKDSDPACYDLIMCTLKTYE